jgi:hypothetical protein
MSTGRTESDTPIPSTETTQPDGVASSVTDAEWNAMQTVLDNVYKHRVEKYVADFIFTLTSRNDILMSFQRL